MAWADARSLFVPAEIDAPPATVSDGKAVRRLFRADDSVGPGDTPERFLRMLLHPGMRGHLCLTRQRGRLDGDRWATAAPWDWIARPALLLGALGGSRWTRLCDPVEPGVDLYMSPQVWKAGADRRRNDALAQLQAFAIDLDWYKLAALAALYAGPDEAWAAVGARLEERGIPLPTQAVTSGRGLRLMWLTEPVPASLLPVWRRRQRLIMDALADFNPDPASLNPTQFFRIPGTTNRKYGTAVRLLCEPLSERYSWSGLGAAIDATTPRPADPAEAAKVRSLRAARARRGLRAPSDEPRDELDAAALAAWRQRAPQLEAALRLFASRQPGGLIPVGQRNAVMFGLAVGLRAVDPEGWRTEFAAVAADLCGWTRRQADRCASAVATRDAQTRAGMRTPWVDEEGTPVEREVRIWLRTSTLRAVLATLGVDDDLLLEAGATALLPPGKRKAEHRRRERVARREARDEAAPARRSPDGLRRPGRADRAAATGLSRGAYDAARAAAADEKAAEARRRHAAGESVSAIARAMSCDRKAVRKWLERDLGAVRAEAEARAAAEAARDLDPRVVRPTAAAAEPSAAAVPPAGPAAPRRPTKAAQDAAERLVKLLEEAPALRAAMRAGAGDGPGVPFFSRHPEHASAEREAEAIRLFAFRHHLDDPREIAAEMGRPVPVVRAALGSAA